MANCADWRIRVNLAVKMKVVGKKHSIADSLQFLRISRNQLTEVVEATFNWILQNFAAWWQNTQTLIGKVCLKSEPCYENIMNTLWKYYENVWKPSVYSLPWSDSPVARSYFITAEKPWKHISLKFKGLQILVHSTVGKIQQQKHAAMVLKNKTEIIKN